MPTGTVLAYSIPDGADVYVDGMALPTRFGIARTPALIPGIYAGSHDITFRLAGYISTTKTVRIEQGGYATVYAILVPVV
jgi:hypothetical protein